MALTFAFYAAPSLSRPLAVGAVVALTAVNYFGVTKTAIVTRVIVAIVLASLSVVVAAVVFGGEVDIDRLRPLTAASPYGILQAAGRCSSHSQGMPGSRHSVRKYGIRPERYRVPFRSRLQSPWRSIPQSQ